MVDLHFLHTSSQKGILYEMICKDFYKTILGWEIDISTLSIIWENIYKSNSNLNHPYLLYAHSPPTMEASTGLFAGSHNSNELVVIQGHEEVKPLMNKTSLELELVSSLLMLDKQIPGFCAA